ncbi:hypothetical protein Ddc_20137 [Ditylenchus destructor]|nr:hypothetical protein Ddc_20137 [Ditylenchus destructor]
MLTSKAFSFQRSFPFQENEERQNSKREHKYRQSLPMGTPLDGTMSRLFLNVKFPESGRTTSELSDGRTHSKVWPLYRREGVVNGSFEASMSRNG